MSTPAEGAGLDHTDLGESYAWWVAVMQNAKTTVICHPAVMAGLRNEARKQGKGFLMFATSEQCPVDQVMCPEESGPAFEFAVSVMRRGTLRQAF